LIDPAWLHVVAKSTMPHGFLVDMYELKVLDLFCGAGGFSEGFSNGGFIVEKAVDSWKPAVATYALNHPETKVIQADARYVNPNDIGKFDVVIGGPPCNEFSYSNRGGGGKIKRGLELVATFLNFVAIIKPRYWLMENVPRILSLMTDEVNLEEYGLDGGVISIPKRIQVNSADFGVPQTRMRAIIGDFILPARTHSRDGGTDILTGDKLNRWNHLGKVIDALPNPLQIAPSRIVSDPNYPDIRCPSHELMDHFYDSMITVEEAWTNRMKKENHPWCGKMKFPDSITRPSRTMTALQVRTSRETIVLYDQHSTSKYRLPTVREYACLQTFPLSYRFTGGLNAKIKMIGNALPPLLSRAFANEIQRHSD